MANSGDGGGTAMKSVIAQLGERQQLASKFASSGRPSPAGLKPQPAANKPTGNGVPGPGRVPLRSPPSSTAKPTVPDVQATSSPSSSRPPMTAGKPSVSSQPAAAAAVAGQPDLLSPSRLKPAIARKPPAVSPPTPSTAEPGDETSPTPPWQNLVRKKNVPPTPVKKQAAATSGVTPSSTAAATAWNADDQLPVGSSSTDDVGQSHDSEQSSAEDPGTTSAAAKVRSLKRAFEGASHDADEVGRMGSRANSGRGGTPRKIDGSSTPASVDENQPCLPGSTDQVDDGTLQSPSDETGLGKPDPPPSDSIPEPSRRQPVIGSSGSAIEQQQVVIGVDGLRYHRLAPPAESTTRPARKPAKPPVVDLAPYRSVAVSSTVVTAVDDDDEIYDDASALPPSDERRVTLRSSGGGTAGRQSATSVVSQISEYTEEEEEAERRRMQSGAAAGGVRPQMSESSDDIYDDVAVAATGDFDEIYEELSPTD